MGSVRRTAKSGSSLGCGTTSCTGQLYCADNGVLGVHQLKTLEMEVAYGKRLAKAEVVYVHHETLGDFSIRSLHFEIGRAHV